MIKVHFHTNLDLIHADKHQWPKVLPFRPHVGDIVRSHYVHPGRYAYDPEPRLVGKGWQLELAVVRVTLLCDDKEGWGESRCVGLDVELHLPPNRYTTLKDFYTFYELVTGSKFI